MSRQARARGDRAHRGDGLQLEQLAMRKRPCGPCDGFGFIDATRDPFIPEPVMVKCANCGGAGVHDVSLAEVVRETRTGRYWTVVLDENERAELLHILRLSDDGHYLGALLDILRLES